MPIECLTLPDGTYRVTFLTARHVVEDAEQMWVNLFEAPNFQFQSLLIPTRLVAEHPTMDAALFTARLPHAVPVLSLDYRVPGLGERVQAAGFAQGRSLNLSEGFVSSLVFYWRWPEWAGAYLTSAFLHEGSSGGAILDWQGDILGIIVGGFDYSEHTNIFLPVLQVQDWIESVRDNWEPK